MLHRIAARLRAVDPYLLLILLLSLPALAPLLAPGLYFYDAHDGRHSVFYPMMFDASLRSGALWPRWAMHHLQGYGYPTFIIVPPLGFYTVSFFVLLGAGFTAAVKLTWITGILLSGVGMYRLLLHWSEAPPRVPGRSAIDAARLAAVAAALLYVYAPYHLLDVYVRGALNESLLFLWLPWLFLAFDKLLLQGSAPGWTRRLATAMLLLAATWLTHSFAVLAVTPLVILFVLFRLGWLWAQDQGQSISAGRAFLQRTGLVAAAGVGGLLLCAVFLVPLLAEQRLLSQQVYTTNTYDFRNHFVQWGQYFSPFWGYGYSDDPLGANDGMGFQVGVLALILAAAGLFVLQRDISRNQRALMLFLAATSAGVMSVMAPVSRPLWEAIPTLAVIQFPWRLLLLVSFTVCTLAGLGLVQLLALRPLHHSAARLPREDGSAMLLFALLAVVGTAAYADPALQPIEPWREDGRAVYRFEVEHPDMITGTQWTEALFTTSPMSDDYAGPDYVEVHGRTNSLTRLMIQAGEGSVLRQDSAGSRFGGIVAMETPGVVRVNVMYFPGWQATVDGAPAPLRIAGSAGLMELDLPAGEHTIDVRMGSTPARTLGTAGPCWPWWRCSSLRPCVESFPCVRQ
jgi:hypothetical protein